MSEEVIRECYTPNYEAAGILLYDASKQQVVLVEQFRLGAFVKQQEPWMIELVMGMVDKQNESAQQVAIREAMEEAGANVRDVVPICRYFNSPGTSSEYVHLFCGLVDSDNVEGVHGVAEEQEDIKVIKMSLLQVKSAISNGKINNASTIIALQWLLLNQESFT
jgi:ADP-ribose pyrophosphatase